MAATSAAELTLTKQSALPREVPSGVLICCWLNLPVLIGSVLIAISSVGIPYGLRELRAPGEVLLMIKKAEAPGQLISVSKKTENRSSQSGNRRGQHSHTGRPSVYYQYSYEFTVPGGERMRGTSRSSANLFPSRNTVPPQAPRTMPVVVEYYPQHAQVNRIRGTKAETDALWWLLVIILPGISLKMLYSGFIAGRRETAMLKSGLLSEGRKVRCSKPRPKGRRIMIQVGNFAFSKQLKSQSGTDERPLAEYQQIVWKEHFAPTESKWGWMGRHVQAGLLGTLVMAVPGVGVGIAGGWLPAIPLALSVGALTGILVENRFRHLLRKKIQKQQAGLPTAFHDVECAIAFDGKDFMNKKQTVVHEIRRRVKLTGDDKDGEPVLIIYNPLNPASAILCSEFIMEPEILSAESVVFRAIRTSDRVLLVAVAALALCFGWLFV